jgi:hypothetical protein
MPATGGAELGTAALEQPQAAPRSASAAVGARRARRHRGVAASGGLAQDHEEGHDGEPADRDQDEEHWIALSLDARGSVFLSVDAAVLLNFPTRKPNECREAAATKDKEHNTNQEYELNISPRPGNI